MQIVDLQPRAINKTVLEFEEVVGHRFIDVNSPEASSFCLRASCLGCSQLSAQLPDLEGHVAILFCW